MLFVPCPLAFVALSRVRVAELAVLMSGAAFCPLDPSYPATRIGHILEDTAPRVILLHAHNRHLVPAEAAASAMLLEMSGGSIDTSALLTSLTRQLTKEGPVSPRRASATATTHATAQEPREAEATDIAYAIFTSGSTGTCVFMLIAHVPARSRG